MNGRRKALEGKRGRPSDLAAEFRALSARILALADRGAPRAEFLRDVLALLLEASGSDAVGLHPQERGTRRIFELRRGHGVLEAREGTAGEFARDLQGEDEDWRRSLDPSTASSTRLGTVWTGRAGIRCLEPLPEPRRPPHLRGVEADPRSASLALIPMAVGTEEIGLLKMEAAARDLYGPDDVRLYEGVAQVLGVALLDQQAQWALRERIKELTCLYSIARLAADRDAPIEATLQGIVDLLPAAWQYPDIATARIVADGRSFTTAGFRETSHRQRAEIVAGDETRGCVEVGYLEERAEADEGPFLREERSLIDAVAREVALVLERRRTEEERRKLREQLRHADRLATIGQLAAGVAHELNEPLGNILGFAQLAAKIPGLPEQAARDLDRIVRAALHAREVVRKLMLFSRQTAPRKTRVDLNQVVREGLYVLESRCAKAGIELVRELSPDLPELTADPSQIHQILVNLVVNAVQAMPAGGRLTVRTAADSTHAALVVEDTGTGMSEEIRQRIFTPFFTTKDVGEGTGLGLAVVHGIVASHGGTIQVESELGRGSRFEVRLPLSPPPGSSEA